MPQKQLDKTTSSPPAFHIISSRFFTNFSILASLHPPLYKHLYLLGHRLVLNFHSQEALIELTTAIMQKIFGYIFYCPKQNLCPRVGNRVNYILWIGRFGMEEIQKQIGKSRKDKNENKQQISLLDIGTGATAIYPLIGSKIYKWKFLATEIDQKSVQNANKIISENKLQEEICILRSQGKSFFDLKNYQKNTQIENKFNFPSVIDFSMCNPPFYEQYCQQSQSMDEEQQIGSNFRMNQNHKPLGTMKQNQFSTQGGQYQFFFEMFRQSFKYVGSFDSNNSLGSHQPIKIRYFTCLFGRLTVFREVCDFLRYQMSQNVLEMYKLGQIRQGSNTRFIVMWRPKMIDTQMMLSL